MIVHKILRGDNAGLYLPFGLSKLRYFAEIAGPDGYFTQKYAVDGYTIEVQQAPPFQYVRVTQDDAPYLEFSTSGLPVTHAVATQDGISFNSYKFATVGSSIALRDGQIALSPTIRKGERNYISSQDSLIGREAQVQLANEPASAVPPRTGNSNRFTRQLYESFAPMHSHTGVHLRNYNLGGNSGLRGPMDAHIVRDVGFDVPWCDGKGKAKVRNAYLGGDTDWPRAAAIQFVSSELGDREFAVSIDALGQVSVFPTSQIGALGEGTAQNIDAQYVKTSAPVLPAWVYKMTQTMKSYYGATADVGLVQFPETDWKFNHLGTKACAVVYERAPVNFDAAFFADHPGDAAFDATQFNDYRDSNTGFAARHGIAFNPTTLPQRYNSAPGLLELSVQITITGANPQDFTVALAITEIRRPTTTAYCTLVAGYAWYDVAGAASAGDMCVLDIERYYRPGVLGVTANIWSLKNLTTGSEVNTFIPGQLTDVDMNSLSFAIYVAYLDTAGASRSAPKKSGAPVGGSSTTINYTVETPAQAIYTFNTFRELLFPETAGSVARAALAAAYPSNARALVTGLDWAMMPLNDLRDWSSSVELTNQRSNLSIEQRYRTDSGGSYTIVSVPSAVINWYSALQVYEPTLGLIYTDAPRFGWYMYTDLLLASIGKTPWSTFYVHPNGTWMFFDQSRVFNAYGVPSATKNYDLSAFDATKLEHVIYDRVHLVSRSGADTVVKETSFLELYNQAVTTGLANDSLTETFLPLTYAAMRATFSAETYTNFDGVTWLQLRTSWGAFFGYYMETAYQGGTYVGFSYGGGNGLLNLSMDHIFYTGSGYSGSAVPPQGSESFPITFSSPVLVQ